jgi:hypothetical protein
MEVQMAKILTTGGRNTDLPIGPAYFSRDYVRRGWFGSTTYPQGGRGVIFRSHWLFGRQTHVDLRLPNGKYLLEVPIDFVSVID